MGRVPVRRSSPHQVTSTQAPGDATTRRFVTHFATPPPFTESSSVPGITTGDAVQAATALLLHGALGRPLLPVAPKRMAVMVQASSRAQAEGGHRHRGRMQARLAQSPACFAFRHPWRSVSVELGRVNSHPAKLPPFCPPLPPAQVPTPEGYFGNAVRMLDVSLPANTSQPVAGDAAGALAALAGAIRQATAAFRAQPVSRLRRS